MRFVADENVDAGIVVALRRLDHDVWYVAEQDSGIDDDQVLEAATSQEALLLTSDKDFGELVFRQGRATSGVLLIRLAGAHPTQKEMLVMDAVEQHGNELCGAFSVLTLMALRIRKTE